MTTKTLWKYTCKANHPVCEAYVLIATDPLSPREAMEVARNWAAANGYYYYAGEGEAIMCLGIISLTEEAMKLPDYPILSAADGEY